MIQEEFSYFRKHVQILFYFFIHGNDTPHWAKKTNGNVKDTNRDFNAIEHFWSL